MNNENYSCFAKWFHHLALGNTAVREISFDLECAISNKSDVIEQVDRPHVFVSGLARAGTSILLRTLYQQGRFATLTYRDMPLVLAPRLWSRVSRWNRRKAVAKQRAHEDGLDVSFDTPESFEEVFWLTFCRREYVHEGILKEHFPSEDVIQKFRRFASHIIAADNDTQSTRYLSKNNNNLLRLSTISKAFPSCIVVIPFRQPFEHASSLLRQHLRFTEIQTQDRFAMKYMSWLGHHEFGIGLKPFTFSEEQWECAHTLDSTNYWLEYWTRVYNAVLDRIDENSVLLNYDHLCEDPRFMLDKLASRLYLPANEMVTSAAIISVPKSYEKDDAIDKNVMNQALETHERLVEMALKHLA